MNEILKQYMFAPEFSAATGYPLSTLRRLCRDGILPHQKMGIKYLLHTPGALEVLKSRLSGLTPEAAKEKLREQKKQQELHAAARAQTDFLQGLKGVLN